MKYLIVFIICFSLLLLRGDAFSHFETIDDSAYTTDEGFEHHHCWHKGFDGYNTEFALSSFNTYYPTPKGIIPASFYEGGVIDVSLKKQMMYVHFGVVAKKEDGSSLVFAGRLYTYGENSTQYVIMNGSSTCYAMPLQYPFPKEWPKVKKVGSTVLGDVEVDVIIMKNNNMTGYNMTRQCSLIRKGSCAPLSSNIGNADKNELGFSLMNFYRYEGKPNLTKIQLPQECYGVTPSDEVFQPTQFDDDDELSFFANQEDEQFEETDDVTNQDEPQEQTFGIHKNLDINNNNHHNRHHRPHPHHRRPHGHPHGHPHGRHPHHGHHPYHPHHITKDGEFIYYPHAADLVLIH
ncbi:hypothetical protein DICPUDRAFT_91843 [Dictyostelium purpureum]|uniref:Uncharacterized protein n=1 Tax=Dictyostelium purpureum TaxID=5786 RepID=F0ZI42_DICPU|nr:uncharacterized protein DICPUDRAFT_91843 [Dictyostelium purpureum]EGC36381.1 hypothetical protein DICPUDRAFT_91843 [Dictyostelium purpureum]|eukprot:XP_003287078.1 hypothetical protein DICPUDRAFT_91843 [Dictyostelium purpureum]